MRNFLGLPHTVTSSTANIYNREEEPELQALDLRTSTPNLPRPFAGPSANMRRPPPPPPHPQVTDFYERRCDQEQEEETNPNHPQNRATLPSSQGPIMLRSDPGTTVNMTQEEFSHVLNNHLLDTTSSCLYSGNHRHVVAETNSNPSNFNSNSNNMSSSIVINSATNRASNIPSTSAMSQEQVHFHPTTQASSSQIMNGDNVSSSEQTQMSNNTVGWMSTQPVRLPPPARHRVSPILEPHRSSFSPNHMTIIRHNFSTALNASILNTSMGGACRYIPILPPAPPNFQANVPVSMNVSYEGAMAGPVNVIVVPPSPRININPVSTSAMPPVLESPASAAAAHTLMSLTRNSGTTTRPFSEGINHQTRGFLAMEAEHRPQPQPTASQQGISGSSAFARYIPAYRAAMEAQAQMHRPVHPVVGMQANPVYPPPFIRQTPEYVVPSQLHLSRYTPRLPDQPTSTLPQHQQRPELFPSQPVPPSYHRQQPYTFIPNTDIDTQRPSERHTKRARMATATPASCGQMSQGSFIPPDHVHQLQFPPPLRMPLEQTNHRMQHYLNPQQTQPRQLYPSATSNYSCPQDAAQNIMQSQHQHPIPGMQQRFIRPAHQGHTTGASGFTIPYPPMPYAPPVSGNFMGGNPGVREVVSDTCHLSVRELLQRTPQRHHPYGDVRRIDTGPPTLPPVHQHQQQAQSSSSRLMEPFATGRPPVSRNVAATPVVSNYNLPSGVQARFERNLQHILQTDDNTNFYGEPIFQRSPQVSSLVTTGASRPGREPTAHSSTVNDVGSGGVTVTTTNDTNGSAMVTTTTAGTQPVQGYSQESTPLLQNGRKKQDEQDTLQGPSNNNRGRGRKGRPPKHESTPRTEAKRKRSKRSDEESPSPAGRGRNRGRPRGSRSMGERRPRGSRSTGERKPRGDSGLSSPFYNGNNGAVGVPPPKRYTPPAGFFIPTAPKNYPAHLKSGQTPIVHHPSPRMPRFQNPIQSSSTFPTPSALSSRRRHVLPSEAPPMDIPSQPPVSLPLPPTIPPANVPIEHVSQHTNHISPQPHRHFLEPLLPPILDTPEQSQSENNLPPPYTNGDVPQGERTFQEYDATPQLQYASNGSSARTNPPVMDGGSSSFDSDESLHNNVTNPMTNGLEEHIHNAIHRAEHPPQPAPLRTTPPPDYANEVEIYDEEHQRTISLPPVADESEDEFALHIVENDDMDVPVNTQNQQRPEEEEEEEEVDSDDDRMVIDEGC